MKHECDHKCNHGRVKFCEKCQKVHCLDCGKEWPKTEVITYPVQPYTPYIPWWPFSPEITCGTQIYYSQNSQ